MKKGTLTRQERAERADRARAERTTIEKRKERAMKELRSNDNRRFLFSYFQFNNLLLFESPVDFPPLFLST